MIYMFVVYKISTSDAIGDMNPCIVLFCNQSYYYSSM